MPSDTPAVNDLVTEIFAAIATPMMRISEDGRLSHTNHAVDKIFETDRRGLHYITALRQPALLEAIEETGRDGTDRVARYYGTDGPREITWRVSIRQPSPDIGGILLAFEDVTAVEEAGQMRRDFIANVSHELRTPLTSLLGFIETLKGAAKDDPVARDRFLAIMEAEAGRMSRLVEDLLSLNRVESEERQRPLEPVNMAQEIQDTVKALQPLAEAQDVTIVTDVPEQVASVPGDAGQLHQVLTNLIENAIKYGGHGGRVDVTLSEPHHEPAVRAQSLRLEVRDHGEGIEPHHLARLTERFYRVDSSRSREIGGTGLGLAIVKHIINRHRGRLTISSEMGEGTTFSVILPLN